MEIVVEPEGAGIVGSEVVASGSGTGSWTGRWKTYKFVATPARGFEFSRFNVDYHYVAPNVSRYGSKSTSSNPFAGGNSPSWTQHGDAEEYDATYDDGSRYAHEILRVTACFADIRGTIEVDASASPSNGGTATVDGRASKTYTGVGGESVSFTLNASAAHGYEFVHWKKNEGIYSYQESFVETETFEVRITEQIHYVAVFREKTKYTIVTVSDPAIGGSTSGGGEYYVGDSCTIRATPAAGCTFVNWTSSNGETVSTATHSFTVSSSVTWTAHFTVRYLVSVSVSPPNAGTASGGGMVLLGSSCTVTTDRRCSPWTFDHWENSNGSVVSRSANYTFTVSGSVTLIAKYTHTNTGQIMCEELTGAILCDSNGNILCNGNLVTA